MMEIRRLDTMLQGGLLIGKDKDPKFKGAGNILYHDLDGDTMGKISSSCTGKISEHYFPDIVYFYLIK